MASWTPPTILSTGVPLPSTAYNGVANNTTFLYQAPFASYNDSAGTSVGSGGDTIVDLGATTFANYGWTLTANTLIVPLTGVYNFNFRVGFQSTATTGGGYCILFHNGNAIIFGSWVTFSATTNVAQSVGSGILPCAQGDGIFLAAFQNSGSTLTTMTGSAQTAIEAFFIGSE